MRSSSVAIRLLSLLLFLVLIGIITYWAMQLLAPRAAIAPNDALGDNSRPPLPVAAKLFGARQAGSTPDAPPPVDIKVSGIVEAGRRGVAILAIDGKPAKAFRVNQRVGDGSILKEVHADKVVIEHRGQRIEAETPSRYNLDILTSNAGKSPPSEGIGEPSADETLEEETAYADEPVPGPADAPPYADGQAPYAQPPGVMGYDPPPGGMPPSYGRPVHPSMGGTTVGRGMPPPGETYDALGQPLNDMGMPPDASEFDPNAPMTGPGGSMMFNDPNAAPGGQYPYPEQGPYGDQPFIDGFPQDGMLDPQLLDDQQPGIQNGLTQ